MHVIFGRISQSLASGDIKHKTCVFLLPLACQHWDTSEGSFRRWFQLWPCIFSSWHRESSQWPSRILQEVIPILVITDLYTEVTPNYCYIPPSAKQIHHQGNFLLRGFQKWCYQLTPRGVWMRARCSGEKLILKMTTSTLTYKFYETIMITCHSRGPLEFWNAHAQRQSCETSVLLSWCLTHIWPHFNYFFKQEKKLKI